ncbi:MAG: hypothetical protein ACO1G6_02875 [Bacteroidota bacterium]
MKNFASKIYFLLTIVFILDFSISYSEEPNKRELTGRWNFVCFYDTLNKLEECPNINNENAFYIEFDPEGKEGIIRGLASKNFLQGEYSMDSENKISFINMWGSKAMELTKCGHDFYDAFINLDSISQRGDSLFVTYGDANKLIKFVKVK